MNYKPPFEITNSIMMSVSSISEKIGYINGITSIDKKIHLRKNNRIKSIHSSLKIEANSLSLNQVRDVINGKVVLGERKEIQEVKNAYEAYEKITSVNPYELNDLLAMHEIMTRYLVNESGRFRSGSVGVFNGEQCIFMAPPAQFVPELMSQLFSWMNKEKGNLHPLILSCVFHYEFVFIHPFSDGNGRMARLWHSAILTDWKPLFEYLPIESQIEKFQEEYYDVIAQCHLDGTSTKFIEFILKQIDSVLDELISQKYDDEISDSVKKLLKVMELNVSYKRDTLIRLLNLKSVSSFRKNYLVPALNMNLIKMTIPDKPNSKNQKYIKI